MKKEIELTIHPDLVEDYNYRKELAAKKLNLNPNEITAVQVIRRSIDARGKTPHFKLRSFVYINEQPQEIFQEIKFTPVKSNNIQITVLAKGEQVLIAMVNFTLVQLKEVI